MVGIFPATMDESLPFASYSQMGPFMDSQETDHEEIGTTDQNRHQNGSRVRKRKQAGTSSSDQSEATEQNVAKFMRVDSTSESEQDEVEDNVTGKTFSSKQRAKLDLCLMPISGTGSSRACVVALSASSFPGIPM